MLAGMEAAGVAIDPRELHAIGREVDEAAARLQRRIYDFAGEDFNIGSPQQLGRILFEKLQIPGGKKTKTGWATGVEVLAVLAREYPICSLVLDWREVTKLKNTYVDVIPAWWTRATAAFTRHSIRRRLQRAACRRPIRICKTSPCAAISAGASVARSSRASATTFCWRPTTAKSSCA